MYQWKDEDSKDARLQYEFPHGHGAEYFGAAHGYFGILYMLLKSFEFLPLQEIPNKCFRLLKNTCDYILSKQSENGNFATHAESENYELVHFCHGAPGAIPFLLECYEFYQDSKYLRAAEKSGELVSSKGILKKGNNLCHGISGNIYCLFNLYKATGDIKWRTRGYCLANATYIKSIQIK